MVDCEDPGANRSLLSTELSAIPQINEDLRPSTEQEKSFTAWELANFWIALVVSLPAYYLAGSLVEKGMSWWQGILTVVAGNLLLLLPLVLIGRAGTQHGIPFPVLCRASFGIRGAHIPALLRAFVACGWFGIETCFGGQALFVLLSSLFNWRSSTTQVLVVVPWIGTSVAEFLCFMAFWVIQGLVIWSGGMARIRKMQIWSAPVLSFLSAALLVWAYVRAGGFGSMFTMNSQLGHGSRFWAVFFPSLTANIGFWAPMALNIADFTRYCRTQADQVLGQLTLPLWMGAYSFLGLAVTASTKVIFGETISNPVQLLGMIGGFLPICVSIIGITLAILTTNIPANIVAPANVLVNLNASFFTFRKALVVTSVLCIMFQPWRFLESSNSYTEKWLVGCSALVGPIGAIIIVDYYALKRCKLSIDDLYTDDPNGEYWYSMGYNINALASLLVGIILVIPGFLQANGAVSLKGNLFLEVYNNSWFVTFFLTGSVYLALSKLQNNKIRRTWTRLLRV